MILTRNQTVVIKGIAILFMIFFHLFGCSIKYEQASLFTSITQLPRLMGYFCGNCVAMFVFATGYGLSISSNLTLLKILNKVLKLYTVTWVISLVLVPIIIFLGYKTFNISDLIKTIFCVGGYNPMYWFIALYPLLLLTFKQIANYSSKFLLLLFTLFLITSIIDNIYHLFGKFPLINFFFNNYIILTPYLLAGILIAKMPSKCNKYVQQYHIPITLLIVGIGLLMLYFHTNIFYQIYCTLFIPVFCIAISFIKQNWLKCLLIKIGNMSMMLWLTHGFLFYYFYQYFYYPKYWLLVFFLFMTASYILAMLMDKLIKFLKVDKIHI